MYWWLRHRLGTHWAVVLTAIWYALLLTLILLLAAEPSGDFRYDDL